MIFYYFHQLVVWFFDKNTFRRFMVLISKPDLTKKAPQTRILKQSAAEGGSLPKFLRQALEYYDDVRYLIPQADSHI